MEQVSHLAAAFMSLLCCFLKKWLTVCKQVVLLKPVEGDRAEELVNKCPANVFDIEDMGIGE